MRTTLHSILELLDEGLRIYRREFPRLALIAALGALPAIGVALLLVRRPDLVGAVGGILAVYGLFFLSLPLLLYLAGAISRATASALDGRAVTLREALAIGPLRLIGMGCYGVLFLLVLNMAVGMLSMFCFCPLFFVIGVGLGGIGSSVEGGALGTALAFLLGVIILVAFVLLYGLSLTLSGATYGSLLFSLQPFVQGGLRFGEALQRSIDMTFYRFGANLLTFLCASLIFGALALSVTLAIGVLVPLPLIFLIGAESALAQGISLAAVIAGLTLALPPLPIWMALLYRRRLVESQGGDLAERIAAFAGTAQQQL
jgi:hypothetical protein